MAILDKLKNKIKKSEKEQQAKTPVTPKTGKIKISQKRKKPNKEKNPIKTDDKPKDKSSTAKASKYYRILKNPHITEKGNHLTQHNQYIFEVAPNANKIEIKAALIAIYNIKPVKINIINLKGKSVRIGQYIGKRTGIKKAIITLPKGKTLDIYEGV